MDNIGKYRILAELGRGAMGIVYHGEDPIIGRSVAIKTIRFDILGSQKAREQAQARFMREARSAGNLSHPNIVTIYDVGEHEGLTYIAMEFINGLSLEELLDSGRRFSFDETINFLGKLGEALDYAHQKGVIHRDIKPANILIDAEDRPFLADFGIARIAASTMTQTNTVMGTPFYMAPEQIAGKKVDGRADLFALGAVLYEMLTLQKPFPGDNITTVIYKIVNEIQPSLRTFQADLPEGLDYVLSKALAKKPEDRYATCAHFAEDLGNHQLFAGKPLPPYSSPSVLPIEPEADTSLQSPEPEEDMTLSPMPYELQADEKEREPLRRKSLKAQYVLVAMIVLVAVILAGLYILEKKESRTLSQGGGGVVLSGIPSAEDHLDAGRAALNAAGQAAASGAENEELRKLREEAGHRFEKALELDPENVDARMYLAELMMMEGRDSDALAMLESLAGAEDADNRLYLNLGQIFEGREETEKALDYYRLYAVRVPDPEEKERLNAKIEELETRIYGSPLEEQPLIDILEKSPPAEIEPERVEVMEAEERAGIKPPPAGKDNQAGTASKPAAGDRPDTAPPEKKVSLPEEVKPDIGSIYSQGLSLFNKGNYPEAITKMQAIVQIDPNHTEAKYYLAVARRRLAARRETQQKQEDVRKILGDPRTAFKEEDYARTIRSAGRVLELDKGNAEARTLPTQAEEKADEVEYLTLQTDILRIFDAYQRAFAGGKLDDFYRKYSTAQADRRMAQQARMLSTLYTNFQSEYSQPELSGVVREESRFIRATLRFIQVATGESRQGDRGEIINGTYTWELQPIENTWKIIRVTYVPRR